MDCTVLSELFAAFFNDVEESLCPFAPAKSLRQRTTIAGIQNCSAI